MSIKKFKIKMTCTICRFYYDRNKKSTCDCSYEHKKPEKQSEEVLHFCVMCKIKVEGTLLDCGKQPICNKCYDCKIVNGVCVSCN